MVNYCCVKGCGRNSRTHSNLTYYSLPKEKERQSQWLTAVHREDLLKGTDLVKPAHRICSRHFEASLFKNRNRLLCPTATPTLCLDGEKREEDSVKPLTHEGFVCDNCQGAIIGFRYTCVECDNYDLCHKCEVIEYHSEHFVLRVPTPNAVNKSKNLIKKIKKELKQHIQEESESSDDEPIQKYISMKQNGCRAINETIIELDNNIKMMLQHQVNQAFKKFKEKRKESCRRTKKRKTNLK